MNTKLFATVSFLILGVFVVFNFALNRHLTHQFSQQVEAELLKAFELQAHVLTGLIRNDLLMENYREARAKLARSQLSSSILGCVAIKSNGEVEELIGFDKQIHHHLKEYQVAVGFGETGETWGHLHFYLNTKFLVDSMIDLNWQLNRNLILTSLVLVIILISLFYLFWQTGDILEKWLAKLLLDQKVKASNWIYQLWRPMMKRLEVIANQFRSVELVINQIEKKNEESTQMAQVLHDLKSPLSALKLSVSQLQDSFEKKELMEKALNRIEKLVSLSIQNKKSRIEKVDPHLEKCELKSVIEKLLPELESQSTELHLRFLSEANKSFCAVLNRTQFERILANLIRNSIEASKEGAEVFMTLRSTPTFNYVTISDKGRGMSPTTLSQLGLVPVTEGKELNQDSGTGQGLYQAFRFVRSWGGEMHVSSEIGRGTQIILALPQAEGE